MVHKTTSISSGRHVWPSGYSLLLKLTPYGTISNVWKGVQTNQMVSGPEWFSPRRGISGPGLELDSRI